MIKRSRIYLAGPLGFSELGRAGQESLIQKLTALGYEVVAPFQLTPKEELTRIAGLPSLDTQRDAWRSMNFRIGETGRQAIDAYDGLLAVLDGVDADSGTPAESGYAFARRKPIVGYRGDFRLSADNLGSPVNLQVEYFILASGGSLITSLATIGTAIVAALEQSREGQ